MKEDILKLRRLGKTYNEIKNILQCAKSTISYHCKNEPKLKLKSKPKLKQIKSIRKIIEIRKCFDCTKNFNITTSNKNQQFCSASCAAHTQNKKQNDEFIKKWKNGEISGGIRYGYGQVSKTIRRYLFNKYNNQCSICSWSEKNIFTNSIPLEVEHLNGNPEDHREENLIILCPNCHSLTRGHSTNKSNGRRYYRQKYHNEKVGVEVFETSKSDFTDPLIP